MPNLNKGHNIKSLMLQTNRLSGSIALSFASFRRTQEINTTTSFEFFSLGNNRISGSIPVAICSLTSLVSLESNVGLI